MTSGESTPYGKAKAVERHLRTNYPYNLRVKPPPFAADGVDHFLFTLGEGYSEYFGSAMAVMLRSVGVPSRLAVGYTTGDQVEGQPVYAVTDSHSHAWVEVYFPGYGWIPFEPTPGETLPGAYQPGTERQEELDLSLGDSESGEENCLEGYDICDEDLESIAPFSGGTNISRGSSIVGSWPWVLAVLAGLAVVGGSVRWFWQRFMAAPGSPRMAFQRMTTLASMAAAGPVEYQTPYQFGRRLRQVMPAQETPVSIIVAAYVRSRYGNKTPRASERRLLALAWQRLRLPMLWSVIRRRVR